MVPAGLKIIAFVHADLDEHSEITRDALARRIARGDYGPAAVISLSETGGLSVAAGAGGIITMTGGLIHEDQIVSPLTAAVDYLAA